MAQKANKWQKRDKKQQKRKYGHCVNGASVKIIGAIINKRAENAKEK